MATLTPQEDSSSIDWQTNKQTVRDRTAFLFNNSLMSDIKFVVTDSQHESDETQVRVPAHKFVLAISSPVFEAMFYGDLAEKREEIELPDTEAICLLEFLRFIYCDEVNLTSDNVLGVLYVAKKYIVPTLAASCKLFLEECADETNACQILEEARRFEESELEERCWEIIDGDTSACLESDRIFNLNNDTLVSLLKRDTLSAKEVHLFEAAKRWAEAKCEDKALERTGSVMRELLGDAVYLIRFPTMSQEEFARHVVPTEILTSNETLQVYRFYTGITTAEQLEFSCLNRATVFSYHKLTPHRCRRYDNNSTFGVSPYEVAITEMFTFKTDKDIYLRGVRLYAGYSEERETKAVVTILTEKDGRQLVTVEGTFSVPYTFKCYGKSNFTYGIDVVFDSPVRVRAGSKYACHATVTGMDGKKVPHNSRTASPTANCAGVNFMFEESPITTCQTLELLFHTVN